MTLISKTDQTVGEARLTVAVNDDDVQAGYNDTAASLNAAGGFLSFPSTASLGTFKFFATNQGGNYASSITNAAFGQASAFVVPDPANAAGAFMVGAGAAPFVSGNVPMASGTHGLFVDSGVALSSIQPLTATVTLTAAEVLAAYATPQLIVAAPGSGKTIIVLNAQIAVNVSTAFASGGVGILQYGNTVHGAGTNALTATTPAADITAASSQIYSQAGIGSVATTVTTGVGNQALYFSNQTGPFTSGTGSTLTLVVNFVVVPVQV
jgi:hypothetical protein